MAIGGKKLQLQEIRGKMSKKKFDFNAGLKELELIVEAMEKDNLDLDEALKKYEKGVGLIRACQQSLEVAEQKIYELSRDDNYQKLTKITPDEF